MYTRQWNIFVIFFGEAVFDGNVVGFLQWCFTRFLGDFLNLAEVVELQDIVSWSLSCLWSWKNISNRAEQRCVFSRKITPNFCNNNSYTENNEKHGTFERCCQPIDKKSNFDCHLPRCLSNYHNFLEVSFNRKIISSFHALKLICGGTILYPNTNHKPNNISQIHPTPRKNTPLPPQKSHNPKN